MIGVESPGSYGRCLVGALAAAGHEVLHVPAWRTHRERRRQGPGKTDPGDALAIADVVRRKRAELGPALRARARPRDLRCSSCSAAVSSATAPRRSSGCAPTGPRSTRSPRPASFDLDRQRELRRLKRISFGDGLVEQIAARCIRELARDIEDLNDRIADARRARSPQLLDRARQPGRRPPRRRQPDRRRADRARRRRPPLQRRRRLRALLRRRTDPLRLRPNRRPPPAPPRRQPPTQRRALPHRDRPTTPPPPAKAFLARKIAEGKTPREARRALKRHLANVIYRRLYAWAETTPAMNHLT